MEAVHSRSLTLTAQTVLPMLGIAILLDVIGFSTVPARINYSSNSAFYLEMVQHGNSSVGAHYRYRVLVPFLARLLPLPADQALSVISHVSLVGCLLLGMLTCARAGLSTPSCIFGATALFCSRAFIYNYVNPYMTDAAALLAIFAMVYAYLAEQEIGFAAAALAGVMAHEMAVFLVPAVLFSRRWKRGLAACTIVGAAFLLTRSWVTSGYTGSMEREFSFISFHLTHLLEWLKAVALVWYLLWPLFLMGIIMLPGKRLQLLVCTCFLTAGSAFLSLFILDTERAYCIMAPVVAVGAAAVFDVLWEKSRVKALGLITIVLAQAASAEAYRTGTRDLRVLAAFSIPAIIYLAYILGACQAQIREGLRLHAAAIREFAAGFRS